ncbi:C-type lectin domain family 4 member M-like [Triplophysa dalaica]|uniref:C-type lectin domain family 4 member M-like n=1 Tax=Triplophysa dalaica TaxID=1582913 RepID=UPI0024DF4ABF|nr:C-type lectin domain family 4 member M-like [Triplophysa dalaica]
MVNTEDCTEMNIYANRDEINSHDVCRATKDTRNNQTFQHTGSETVRNRSHRSVLVCLVVLCVLLLTAVIVLCVLIYTNNHQFHINNKNITEERDQLLTQYTNITEDRDQLLTKYTNITEDRDELRAKFNNVTKLYEELRTHLYDGWIYYEFSLYFISSEKKNWIESRRNCRERGADLIIINNKDEQDFIEKKTCKEGFWIGLSDSDEEGRWKWVDGSAMTSGFWKSGEPNGRTKENCVESAALVWNDLNCHVTRKWICERIF